MMTTNNASTTIIPTTTTSSRIRQQQQPEQQQQYQNINTSNTKNYNTTNDNNTTWKQTLAGIAGNVLEWYDFAIFGYFGDIIGTVFFPPVVTSDTSTTNTTTGTSTTTNNINTSYAFLLFGIAFFIRPIGGIVLGYIGDIYGRKVSLMISIFLMAIPTFVLGCLPTYNQIGSTAIVLLILIRLLQGFSVGGQLISSLCFTLEQQQQQQQLQQSNKSNNKRNNNKWGFYGSLVMSSASFGILLGSAVATTIRYVLTYQQLIVWGWRIPFLAGIFVSISGFYLKSTLHYDNNQCGEYNNILLLTDESISTSTTNNTNTNYNDNNYDKNASKSNIPANHIDGVFVVDHLSTDDSSTSSKQNQQSNALDNDKSDRSVNKTNDHNCHSNSATMTMTMTTTGVPVQQHSISHHHYHHNNPIRDAFAICNLRSLLAATLVPMLAASAYYLCFVWMAIYMTQLLPENERIQDGFVINTAALLFSACILYPIAGILSDIYGRVFIMSIGGIGLAICSPGLIYMLRYAGTIHNPMIALCCQWILGLFVSLYNGPMCAWLVESFPVHIRLTSVSIGYNIANMIAGGMTPYIATRLVSTYGPESPGWILSILSIISLTGLLCVAPKKPTLVQLLPSSEQQQPQEQLPGYQQPLDNNNNNRQHHSNMNNSNDLYTITTTSTGRSCDVLLDGTQSRTPDTMYNSTTTDNSDYDGTETSHFNRPTQMYEVV